jgi:serine protease AprX
MKAKKEHPILVVAPRANDLKQKVISGFGEPKELVPVNRALRGMLVEQLGMVEQEVAGTNAKYPELPTVITLRLRTEAMAKSNRPIQLLERVGMLPIGTQGRGCPEFCVNGFSVIGCSSGLRTG